MLNLNKSDLFLICIFLYPKMRQYNLNLMLQLNQNHETYVAEAHAFGKPVFNSVSTVAQVSLEL